MNTSVLKVSLSLLAFSALMACANHAGVDATGKASSSASAQPSSYGSQASPSGALASVAQLQPVVVNKSFISPLVELFGDVSVGQKVFVAGNTILRADPETKICIGDETNLQDNILFLALRPNPGPASACGPRSSSTQRQVSIAHQAVIVNSAIGNFTFVGFRSRIENSVLEDGAFVLHGATVSNVRIGKDRLVPTGAVIKTQREADALPMKAEAYAKFQKDVLHVNHEFAEKYVELYGNSGFDAVTGVSVAPQTSFNKGKVMPTLGKNVKISEFARVVGDVRIGDNSVIGGRTSIRADEGTPIIIGENADIEDRVTFHALEHTTLTIGRNLKAGHNVVFHGPLVVGDDLAIADDAILFRSKVGSNVLIGDSAIVIDVTLRDGVKVPNGAIIDSQAKADALAVVARK